MDFSILRAFAMVLRTWPFLLLRLALSAMVMVSYAFGIGTGAGLGWGIGGLWPPDGEAVGALIGAFAGFCSIALVWVWLRVYLVYLLKGGHVAALVAALDGAPLPRGPFSALAFTSAHGVRALAARPQASALRSLPVFTVGGRTGAQARTAGFAHVIEADGNIEALAALLSARLAPGTRILHAAGADRA
ncbi:MAG: hypothetical protein B7X99_19925, partial [Rhizobiales bacterium 17-65-6]